MCQVNKSRRGIQIGTIGSNPVPALGLSFESHKHGYEVLLPSEERSANGLSRRGLLTEFGNGKMT